MRLEKRIKAFILLGNFMSQFSDSKASKKENISLNDSFFIGMQNLIKNSKSYNGWFTKDNLYYSLKCLSESLSEQNINHWLSAYTIQEPTPKTVALIMAGNIPLVGFHDFISVLISGNKVLVKLSSKDKQLLPYLANYLIAIDDGFKDYITFTEEKLENFDAVIATGSNNSARYFEYYFGKYPNIIRKNRNSIALLTGHETKEQLEDLANDIFRYFGMGCRNVSKIYLPLNYNFDSFFNAIYCWKEVINDNKYMNNYDYNKAVYLMSTNESRGNLLDNEFLLLKEDKGFSSPISVVFYETFTNINQLKTQLLSESESIQCTVANVGIDSEIDFGQTQNPKLWEYADDIDTLDFLLKLHE